MNGRTAAGFTLVEVLVALVIMAVMAGMAWQGIDGIVRARDASQARMEQTLRLNTVMAQWDQDLASIQSTDAVPALRCTGAVVAMTRRAPGGIQYVVWTMRPAADNTSTWERWASPPVTTRGELSDIFLRSQQLQGGEPGSIQTIAGLSARQVYYFKTNAWSNCQSTLGSDATTGAAVNLPDGVRLVLSFAPGSGFGGDLTRDTLIRQP